MKHAHINFNTDKFRLRVDNPAKDMNIPLAQPDDNNEFKNEKLQ
jgi:hypothetical protein